MPLEKLTKSVLGFLPYGLLSNKHSGPLLPCYHVVSDKKPPHTRNLYSCRDIEVFKNDLVWLLKHYKPVSLDDLNAWLKDGTALPANCFHLTFDDGMRECHDIIAPILKHFKVSATFFLCSAFIDNKQMFYRNKISLLLGKFNINLSKQQDISIGKIFESEGVPYNGFYKSMLSIKYSQSALVEKIADVLDFSFDDYLKTNPIYLTSEQIEHLLRDGFSIGAHSVDHPRYADLTLEQQIYQTKESTEFLSSRFPINCRAFAFPHSDAGVTLSFFGELSQSVDIFFGTAQMKKDQVPNCLQRFSLENDSFSCSEIIKGNLLKQAMNTILGKNNIKRRQCPND